MKKIIIFIVIVIVISLGINYFLDLNQRMADIEKEVNIETDDGVINWKNVGLIDVLTDKKFKISDFTGKIILLESFAVWCPTCLKQQKEIKKLLNEDIVHISLDTDPNEDGSLVRNHALTNSLDWRFVISPIEMTRALINEFGVGFVSAPSAPVLLICKDQSSRFLKRGVKSADELKSEIKKGC